MSDETEVFSFYRYDGVNDRSILSPIKRERADIEALKYELVEESREIVKKSDLDEHGRYHPK